MKQLSAIAARVAMIAVFGAMATGLAACGGSKDNSTPTASSVGTTSTIAASTATSAAVSSSTRASNATKTPSASLDPALGPLCSTFRNMDVDAEKTAVEKVLAANPGSKFQGSPNVALGTAKLVCLAHSEQDEPLAVAIGVAQK